MRRPDHGTESKDGLQSTLRFPVGVALLLFRGLALWVLLPVGVLAWLVVFSWRDKLRLGEFLGWLDLNAMALMQRTVFAAWIPRPTVDYIPLRDSVGSTYRVGIFGLL
ncbi:hypothetical protein ACDF64_12710 [Agromyces sp. MMS24-JH15]|uniref:hypothetical protein n=1 Tax=Agromyces sp. MMS24-JH15 TaxID=3243765 RepID=UPI00374828D1